MNESIKQQIARMESEEYAKYTLYGVKPGDTLVVYHGIHSKSLAKVQRVTATQVVTKAGQRFRIKDGCVPGSDSYMRVSAAKPRPGQIEEIHIDLRIKQIVDALDRKRIRPAKDALESFWAAIQAADTNKPTVTEAK